jgi:hypothetical protein
LRHEETIFTFALNQGAGVLRASLRPHAEVRGVGPASKERTRVARVGAKPEVLQGSPSAEAEAERSEAGEGLTLSAALERTHKAQGDTRKEKPRPPQEIKARGLVLEQFLLEPPIPPPDRPNGNLQGCREASGIYVQHCGLRRLDPPVEAHECAAEMRICPTTGCAVKGRTIGHLREVTR